MELILPNQRKDGIWVGRGSGVCPVVDTCFALLFLKRTDLLPGLRETLQRRILITYPGIDRKGTGIHQPTSFTPVIQPPPASTKCQDSRAN